jgi:alpha-L-fucosidase 2
VKGLRARDGFTVDMAWRNGTLVGATIHAALGGICRVNYPAALQISVNGQAVVIETQGTGSLNFATSQGSTYTVTVQKPS